MEFIEQLSLFLQSTVQMGTPILFGTLGGILNEKVGHTNLGVEGMMLMGACSGFMMGVNTGNPVLAILTSGLVGALCALIYAFITVTFMGNHVVTGLVLTIFGTGLSSFLGNMTIEVTNVIGMLEKKPYTQVQLPQSVAAPLSDFEVPYLSDIPILGNMIFSQSIYVYISIVFAVILAIYMKRTRFGLNMRMIGENPAAADASGINITAYKYIHILLGGFLCGMGGAYISLVSADQWKENLTAGIGWIAVALVIFATWDPVKAIFGAYFFGAMRALGPKLQNADIPIVGHINSQFLDMIPYIMTIVVLIFITLRKKKEYQAPAALGSPYFREDR
ncbi:MAG: ABC transporter permease [Clostridia bacterium]|nr:ABC transporter permease [Clostridia bacterium]